LWATFCSCVLPPTGSWSQRYKRQVKRRQQWQPETGSRGGGGGGAGGAGAGWRRISCPVPATKTTITMRKGIGGKTELKIKLRGIYLILSFLHSYTGLLLYHVNIGYFR